MKCSIFILAALFPLAATAQGAVADASQRPAAHATNSSAPRRPQEESIERSPPQYSEQKVNFLNSVAGNTLAGTLSIPKGKGPFPAVLLIAGSGPATRDVEFAGHRVFLVLADYLTRRGIAVLRYDKRGTGDSTGDFESAGFSDLVSDARASFSYLKGRPEVEREQLGVIGHSEGATIAPEIAILDSSIRMMVLMAGSGLRGDQLLTEQRILAASDEGASAVRLIELRAFYKALFAAVVASTGQPEAKIKVKPLIAKGVAAGMVPQESVTNYVEFITSNPIRELLAINPIPTLRQIRIPVLAIIGSLDHTVVTRPYLEALRPALQANRRAVIKEMPKLNHMFQTAITGEASEFSRIEETIAPAALMAIGDWIANEAKTKTN